MILKTAKPNTLLICLGLIALYLSGCRPAGTQPAQCLRVATFNTSLYRPGEGRLYADLRSGDRQIASIARIIQHVRPDILLLNEFDYDPGHQSMRYFVTHYLAVAQGDGEPLCYPYCYTAPVNTGVPSGFDLDHDGRTDGPADAFGYGRFPGQYGMVLLSRYPIREDGIRTFQRFLWNDMPEAMLPDDPETPPPHDWYSPDELAVVRLSSKSHWDVPFDIHGDVLHLLVSHPTPPVFDGPEDRNGKRNHDEIRFWADYVVPERSGYIYDDHGTRGGLAAGALFVIAGDLNADPHDGDSTAGAIHQLLGHPDIQDPQPTSEGALQAALTQKAAAAHRGAADHDTYCASPRSSVGNLRLDYVLPSKGITVLHSEVFWPREGEPLAEKTDASDHRLVYADLQLRDRD